MRLILGVLLAVSALFALPTFAVDAIVYEQEDSSPAIRIHNGFDADIQVVFPAGDNADCYVLVGAGETSSNNLDLSGSVDTIDEVHALLLACTNTSGQTLLTIDSEPSLGADSTDDELLDSQDITIAPGDWGELVWDTSVCLFYSVYIPGSRATEGTVARKTLKRIYGNVGGTGNITVNIYEDQTEVYEYLVVSPVYIAGVGAASTNEYTADAIGPAQLSIDLDFPFGVGRDYMIRAAHATTGTSGSLGAIVEIKQ
jgi:hypothetical protein